MFIYIKMDAESNKTTPAISFPLCQEDKYMYACVFMYNMHILDKNTFQVSRNVHILNLETFTHIIMDALEMFIYIKMDAESDETTPAMLFRRFHEDHEMFTKNDVRSWSGRTQIVELEKKQGQIWNQRPLKRWRPLRTLPK